jgi:DNA-binding MurR/RpiR family transcriptional regulator
MELLTRMSQMYATYTGSEKKIANFLLQHTEEAVQMNLHMLSRAIHVSSSTISRFVRTIGFDKYSQLIIELARDFELRQRIADPVTKNQDGEYANMQLSSTIQTAIVQTLSLQNRKTLQAAAEAILNAQCTYLIGMGTSGLLALDFQQKLVHIDQHCVYHNDYTLNFINSAFFTPRDVVFAISYTGRVKDVLGPVEIAKINGARTIGVTQFGSQLTKFLDIHIPIPSVNDGLCYGANLSRYAQAMAIDMLHVSILDLMGTEKVKQLAEIHQTLALKERQ